MSALWLILLAAIPLVGLAIFSGALLGFAEVRFKVEGNPIADQLNDILPQTQCGQCGYPGCRPYAEAMANGEKINKCPPGGESTIRSEEHTSELQSRPHLVCRLLLEKKKTKNNEQQKVI